MNVIRENKDELNAILKIKVDKQDYTPEVEKTLKDYRKKANVKGFRVGMAPMGMIKKLYGKSVLLDEVNKLVSKSLTDYIREEKIKILGEPMPSEEGQKQIDFDKDEDFEFSFDIGLTPEFELKLSKRDKLTFNLIKVDDDMIEKTIENHKMQGGSNQEVDKAEEKDIVKGKFEQLDADGNVNEQGVITEDAIFAVDRVEEESIRALVIGAKKDSIIDFELKKAFSNTADIASMLRIDKEKVAGLDGNFRFTIKSISRHVPAEVNQDLFDKIYGKDAVKSEEEYKNRIIEDIKAELIYQSDFRFGMDVKDKLVKKANITLPDAFLKRWLVAVNKDLTAEQVEKDYANMQTEFAWQLIKNKIIEEQEIKVEEADILNEAKQSILAQFKQYGIGNLPDEQLEPYAKQVLQQEQERNRIVEQLYEKEVVTYVKNTIKVEEKEIDAEAFSKLFEK